MSSGGQLAFEVTLRVTAAISIALRILSTSTQGKSPDASVVLSHGPSKLAQVKHRQSHKPQAGRIQPLTPQTCVLLPTANGPSGFQHHMALEATRLPCLLSHLCFTQESAQKPDLKSSSLCQPWLQKVTCKILCKHHLHFGTSKAAAAAGLSAAVYRVLRLLLPVKSSSPQARYQSRLPARISGC